KGVGIFLLLTVLVPLVATVVASFGPREWITDYVHPARRFQPLLYVLAGALAALPISQTPFLSSVSAAAIGSVATLALAVGLGAAPHLDPTYFAVEYLLLPVAYAALGASCTALAKRGFNAL